MATARTTSSGSSVARLPATTAITVWTRNASPTPTQTANGG